MKREEQKIENTWSIDEIYINDNQINEIKNEIIKKVDEIARLKGQITKNIDTLHSIFEMDDYIVMKALIFPYINVLWLGVVVMVIGFFLSFYNRKTKKEVK